MRRAETSQIYSLAEIRFSSSANITNAGVTELGYNTHPATHTLVCHCQTDCKMLGPFFLEHTHTHTHTHTLLLIALPEKDYNNNSPCRLRLGEVSAGRREGEKEEGRNRFNNRAQIDVHWERKTRRKRERMKDRRDSKNRFNNTAGEEGETAR